MGLDILLFRAAAGGNPDIVRESQRRRYSNPADVDAVIEWDEKWRKLTFLSERIKRITNDVQRVITSKKKAKEADGADGPIDSIVEEVKQGNPIPEDVLVKHTLTELLKVKTVLKDLDTAWATESQDAEHQRDQILRTIGNIVHEEVPISDNEENNRVDATFGTLTTKEEKPLNHVDIMERLGAMDTSEHVTKMSGGRAYALKGPLVLLQMALENYAVQFLCKREFKPFYPPVFMNKDVMGEVAQLSQFDDELYKVTGEGDDKYLIATAEQPLAAYHRNQWFQQIPKPIKYAGMSCCFRKEVGAHGRDTLGIFRVHQFDKVEQFIVCSPRDNESWKMLDHMVENAEEFYKSLGLAYRVVSICSGEINNAAAMKRDLEAWFPASQHYRELVSCSNCTDYQSRSLNFRFGQNQRGTSGVPVKEHPHMLNGTMCAITRTMCCIVENYQVEDGVIVPEVLRPYMMGMEKIPFDPEAVAAIKAAEEKEKQAAEQKAQKEAAKSQKKKK